MARWHQKLRTNRNWTNRKVSSEPDSNASTSRSRGAASMTTSRPTTPSRTPSPPSSPTPKTFIGELYTLPYVNQACHKVNMTVRLTSSRQIMHDFIYRCLVSIFPEWIVCYPVHWWWNRLTTFFSCSVFRWAPHTQRWVEWCLSTPDSLPPISSLSQHWRVESASMVSSVLRVGTLNQFGVTL